MATVTDAIDAALESIKKNNLALDINTSGLRKGTQEIFPGRDILKRAFALQIPVVMGSDAHKPSEVAADFDSTITLLKTIGYDRLCTFENRQRKMIKY